MPENNGPIFSSTPAGDTANAPKPPGETPVPAIRIFGVGTAGINILATLGGEMVNPESLIAEVRKVAGVKGAAPFVQGLVSQGKLAQTVTEICRRHTGQRAELSTTGGTSDARFIIEIAPEVLDLGPVNASIHKLNEHIALDELEMLPRIYLDVLRALLP